MKRTHLAQALLIASLGAFATAGYAADTKTADKTPGSPGTTATQSATGAMNGNGMQNNGMQNNDMQNGMTGTMRTPMTSEDIREYEQARTVCDKGPASQRTDCWSSLTTKYSQVGPKCQKLTGNALEACLHQDQTQTNKR